MRGPSSESGEELICLHKDPPTTYNDLTKHAQKISQNLNINQGLQGLERTKDNYNSRKKQS